MRAPCIYFYQGVPFLQPNTSKLKVQFSFWVRRDLGGASKTYVSSEMARNGYFEHVLPALYTSDFHHPYFSLVANEIPIVQSKSVQLEEVCWTNCWWLCFFPTRDKICMKQFILMMFHPFGFFILTNICCWKPVVENFTFKHLARDLHEALLLHNQPWRFLELCGICQARG